MNGCSSSAIPLINQPIRLSPRFLGACGLDASGDNLQGTFMWVVQSVNCNGVVEDLASWDEDGTSNDFISNNDRTGSGELSKIIRVPESGSFSIRIEIQFTDGFCSSCCSNIFRDSDGRRGCPFSGGSRGAPVFGSVIPVNSFTASVSPIEIEMSFFSCLNCGLC